MNVERNTAPWGDFKNAPIHLGDRLRHPSGEEFIVVFDPVKESESVNYGWRAVYEGGVDLWLGNQIGSKGMAVLIERPASAP